MAKELAKEPWIHDFLRELPHTYFEEMCIHGFILEQSKEYEPLIEGVDAWLPYVDNWAACDMVNPKLFKKRPDGLLLQIRKWMADSHPYTVRFGIGMLMRYYLDDFFQEEYLEWAAGISSKEYYVNMMIAWFFATALAKQYDAALTYLEQNRLETWIHNKTIQKAVESRRIEEAKKRYLKTLRK